MTTKTAAMPYAISSIVDMTFPSRHGLWVRSLLGGSSVFEHLPDGQVDVKVLDGFVGGVRHGLVGGVLARRVVIYDRLALSLVTDDVVVGVHDPDGCPPDVLAARDDRHAGQRDGQAVRIDCGALGLRNGKPA